MRIVLVSHHAPRREGTASGRMAFAWLEAARAQGHDATAVCWGDEPTDLPGWATWLPLPPAPRVRVKARSLLAPRTDVERLGWTPPEDAVVVADDTISFPAVVGAARHVANVHNSLVLDRRALGGRAPSDAQDRRAERRLARRAQQVWTSSARVKAVLGRGDVVPYTLPLPEEVPAPVTAPVAGMIADWAWAPNRVALEQLLRAWPEIRSRVPGAQLLLAGRGGAGSVGGDGVRDLGEVPRALDLLSRVAVLAFPCPDTSGAKMKSFEAVAHGVALLTTPAGAEGLPEGVGEVVGPGASFVEALVGVLSDEQARVEQARASRQLLLEHHAPSVAALARLRLLARD